MAEQLTFDLHRALPPTFDNFVVGPNVQPVAALKRVAAHEIRETGLVIWGAHGAGKSHLLQAAVAQARDCGREALYIDKGSRINESAGGQASLIAIDDVDEADAAVQGRLFTLYNALAAAGGQLIAAASVPPARMTLREDVRTRLGWGLVMEVLPLTDAEKPAALASFAQSRGLYLPIDVIDYLLAHGRRDMATLVRSLTLLDRYSLARSRPLTVPLVREWLERSNDAVKK
ncbi:MAG TPA: DnaA regulatory inactivator Hda [Casimicrobiaceae bacterium]|nr:DnaA regulatory inactivator Hda [Casimicrobiaceae bacterium]